MSAPVPVPAAARETVAGYAWTPAGGGASGAAVYRLHAPGRPTRYVKHAAGDAADEVAAESERLRWLAGRVAVPTVLRAVRDGDAAFLLPAALPGRAARDAIRADPASRDAVVPALAALVRARHALPADDCPFDAGHARRLADARRRIDAGLVDADDFDDERAGRSPAEVWDAMTALLPLPFGRVVTHGDCTLDNLLVADGRVTGCLDVGRAGMADPYQDLALLWNDLGEFGDDAREALLAGYGETAPDRARLEFHRCLDEFF
ncbi:APH(3') family aminoglycoside O-phosphotransferase [Roseisolibacter sp. H3M3-2]|uniref:APH(3') family aminoglycoside O-phosphotransferase n=1 Tax=Roseisolibacter sp. H3M3-2 TaxID=3031323 RepID=UPI0023DA1E42|nr:APH(3') family aminoglycoside O-phosphotransferase [Roseisolibacter sp. H3M3-2]MDF1502233.1 aminoglycoside 3'-phosphotransferase [Roseisolibacter sp. H3M3-2]